MKSDCLYLQFVRGVDESKLYNTSKKPITVKCTFNVFIASKYYAAI